MAAFALAIYSMAGFADAPIKMQMAVPAPYAAGLFYREPGSHELSMHLYSVAGTQLQRKCESMLRSSIGVAEHGRLRISWSVADADETQRVNRLLDTPLATSPSLSMRELLASSTRALEVMLRAMAAPQGRPEMTEFELQLAAPDCAAQAVHSLSGAQARRHVVFPVLIPDIGLQATPSREIQLQLLLGLIAHEMAHLVQLHPYTLVSLNRFMEGQLATEPGETSHQSIQGEVGAQLFGQCFSAAVMPSPQTGPRLALLWRDHRPLFARQLRSQWERTIFGSVFARQQRAAGGLQFGVVGDRYLLDQFALCAAELDRQEFVKEVSPGAVHRQRGGEALNAVRAVFPRPVLIDQLEY